MPNTRDVPTGWYATLAASVALMPIEALLTFALWFAPGWANGFPTSKHLVWSAGIAILLFVTLMTGAVAVGAVYAIAQYRNRSRSHTWRAFAVWVCISVTVVALHCMHAGHMLYLRSAGK